MSETAARGPSVVDKRTRMAELRKLHQPVFDEISQSDAFFVCKAPHYRSEVDRRIVQLYPSEIRNAKGRDIFIEFTSLDYVPEEDPRMLRRWKYNPNWETDYQLLETKSKTGIKFYAVPVDEIPPFKIEKQQQMSFRDPEEDDIDFSVDDAELGEMSLRDFAAIMWKSPVSQRPWLNELIRNKFNAQ